MSVEMNANVAILVLTYNGRDLLARCLPTVVKAANRMGSNCRVVVVDNCSIDDSVSFLRREFPTVEVHITSKNDFLFSYNDVVRTCLEDLVVILNNDMQVDEGFIPPLVAHFADPRVFAVTCRIHNWNGVNAFETVPDSLHTVQCLNGWFEDRYDPAPDYPCCVQLASGGASAFRRAMFCELGGFDDLFRPGYCEDSDLSYQAWRRGWQIIYEPRSLVYHFDSVSMRQRYGDRRYGLALRNRLLMVVKSMGNSAFLVRFLLLYPKRLCQHLLWGDRLLGRALLEALVKLPKALFRRLCANARADRVLSDTEIVTIVMRRDEHKHDFADTARISEQH